MSEVIIFFVGLFIGSIIGVIFTGLCSASGNSERERYIQQLQDERDSAIDLLEEHGIMTDEEIFQQYKIDYINELLKPESEEGDKL